MKKRHVVVGSSAGVLLLIGGYVALAYAMSGHGDTVARNTEVSKIAVGGMNVNEAARKLDKALAERFTQPVALKIDDKPFQIVPADAGMELDALATVRAASGFLWSPSDVFGRLFGVVALDPALKVNDAELATAVSSLSAEVSIQPVEPSIGYDKLTPVVRPGSAGQVLNSDELVTLLKASFLQSTPAEISVSLVEKQPMITDAAATDFAGEDPVVAVAAPVTVNATGAVGSGSAVLTPLEIASSLQWVSDSVGLVPFFDHDKLRAGVEGEFSSIEKPGRDATFTIVNGRPVLVPAITGIGVTGTDLANAVVPVLNATTDREVTVSLGLLEPQLSTNEARALGIVEKLSSFTQKYPYAQYRSINIGKAAEYINGSIVLPGAEYSHNDTLRERTEANGYVKGFIIGPGGIFKEELGGGVSASATATWTAAYFAGMEPVQVRAHSIWIPRYQAGLEATVSWGNFDMKFRNPYSTGVFMTASTSRTSITIDFWGTKQYDQIRAESGPKVDIRPYETVTSSARDCLEQAGMMGFKITVDRVFVKGGVEVRRESTTTSYRPTPHVRCAIARPTPSNSSPRPTASTTASSPSVPSSTPTTTPVATEAPSPVASASAAP